MTRARAREQRCALKESFIWVEHKTYYNRMYLEGKMPISLYRLVSGKQSNRSGITHSSLRLRSKTRVSRQPCSSTYLEVSQVSTTPTQPRLGQSGARATDDLSCLCGHASWARARFRSMSRGIDLPSSRLLRAEVRFAFRGITQGWPRVRVRLWPTPSFESSTLTKNQKDRSQGRLTPLEAREGTRLRSRVLA